MTGAQIDDDSLGSGDLLRYMAHRMAIIRRLVVLGLLIVVGSAIFRAVFVFKSRPPPKPCLESGSHHNITLAKDPAILKRFIDILNIPSISYEPHLYDADQMLKIIQYIEKSEYIVTMVVDSQQY